MVEVGMHVCISIKKLFETFGSQITHGFIDHSCGEEGDCSHYYDLCRPDGREVLCMDGESCLVTSVSENSITLVNCDVTGNEFMLSKKEFECAAFIFLAQK